MIFHFNQKNPKKKFFGGRLHIKLVGFLADPLLKTKKKKTVKKIIKKMVRVS
jgi:hypothetical protein